VRTVFARSTASWRAIAFDGKCRWDYIADFCCLQLGLPIKADGSRHPERGATSAATRRLSGQRHRALRFWDLDIHRNREGVMEAILDAAAAGREAALKVLEVENRRR